MKTTWQRLAPFPIACPTLDAIAAELERPETRAELAACDVEERYPEKVRARLHALGLGALLSDEPRLTAWHLDALCAIAAHANGSLAITLGVNCLALLPCWIAASNEQRARLDARLREGAFLGLLLTELDHGSNLLANRARAIPGTLADEGGFVAIDDPARATHFRLEGEKQLINGGQRHQLLVTLLRTREPESGGPAASALGAFSLFAIDRERDSNGIVALDRWRTLPTPAADISGVRFDGAVIPRDTLLGDAGTGFSLIQQTLSISRGSISALASGAATAAHELACAFAEERNIYGAPIATLGAIAAHLDRMRALDLAIAALSVKQAAMVNALGLGAAHYTALAKLACCRLAEEAVDEGRRVLGARALLAGLPYTQRVRDVLLYGVFDGTSHVMLDQIQWRLTQEAARAAEAEDTLAGLRAVYAAPPAPLPLILRKRARAHRMPIPSHARALAALPGLPLAPLPQVASALLETVRALREKGAWERDQALRFEAAEIYALFEVVLAVAELADPSRRTALGLAPLDDQHGIESIARTAIGWLGARAASRLRTLALTHDLPTLELDHAERALVALVHPKEPA